MLVSFHSHSGQFCHHAAQGTTLEEVVQAAIHKGFTVYGLSEHMPRSSSNLLYPEEIERGVTCEQLEKTFVDYIREARRLQSLYSDKIRLLVGMETEFILPRDFDNNSVNSIKSNASVVKEAVEPVLRLVTKYNLDYLVASVHHVNGMPIDFSRGMFEEAQRTLFPIHHQDFESDSSSYHQMMHAYFTHLYLFLSALSSSTLSAPVVIGHFDLVRIWHGPSIPIPDTLWPLVDSVLEIISSKSKSSQVDDGTSQASWLVELNSRAWKKGVNGPYPMEDVMKRIRTRFPMICFTTSDDSHGPADVGLFYEELQEYITKNNVEIRSL